eukprot:1074962-Alexandrium_andersonii.AAC.1
MDELPSTQAGSSADDAARPPRAVAPALPPGLAVAPPLAGCEGDCGAEELRDVQSAPGLPDTSAGAPC